VVCIVVSVVGEVLRSMSEKRGPTRAEPGRSFDARPSLMRPSGARSVDVG